MVSRWIAAGLLTVLLCGCSDKSPPAPAGKGPGPVPPTQGSSPAAKPAPGSGAAAQSAPGAGSATAKPAPAIGSATLPPQGSGTPAAKPAPIAPGPGPDLVPPQTAPKPAPAGQTGASATPPAPAVDPSAQSAPNTELVKAQKSVGKQGRSLDEHEGMIVTPAKTFFTVRERLVFEVQVPDALRKYKAVNDKGPASHEQFMKEIIEANLIKLPQLNEDCSYVYDPKTEELMVRRPKR